MTGDLIRARFLEFFQGHDHLVLPSAKLRPDDPTTHFTTAGMQPFVPYFLGNEQPPQRRIATCQKCLRSDDLDEVGYTARHLSFFEMLGNFSFGDYFKKEAIAWGWEFVLQGLELDPELLWVSVYENDDDAAAIWRDYVGVKPERIVRFGMADNWWGPVGNSGPCGPCSEIFLDRGPAWGDATDPTQDEGGDRYVELWNLVFQQYNATCSKKELMATRQVPDPLPAPGIDTGAGLERIAAAMQGVSTVFETDLMRPLCDAVIERARVGGTTVVYGADKETTAAVNRISDHIRALTFAITDGIFPSNKAGGYVLRQILRRAARFGRMRLGLAQPFLHELVPAVVARYSELYPELVSGQATVVAQVKAEEERFSETLNQGIPRLEDELSGCGGSLSGERAFFLYETYGVPIEVQVEVATEQSVTVDVASFEHIRTSRERSAIAVGFTGHGDFGDDLLADVPPTTFVGYGETSSQAKVLSVLVDAKLDETRGLITEAESCDTAVGGGLTIILDRSPFYGESGGQVGDTGRLTADGVVVEISDTRRDKNGRWLHLGRVAEGALRVGTTVTASVDIARRDAIRRAHTATHLLHAALRRRLGEHVAQAGSLVEPDRLRFDFSHFSGLSADDLAAVEAETNERILANHPLRIEEHSIEEARRLGALMFFGEKYGKSVRVVNVGAEFGMGLSTELCGGTHAAATGNIGSVRIVSEASVGSGIRRVEALTGLAALDYGRSSESRLREVAATLKAPVAEVSDKLDALQARLREAERQLAAAQAASASGQVDDLLAGRRDIAGVAVVAAVVVAADADSLKALADDLCDKLGDGVALLGAALGDKVLVVAKASDSAVARGAHAGNSVKAAAQVAGGGGGGRPAFAQAGGRDVAKLDEAVAAGLAALEAQLG
ncbi:MAG: alanine--tRNA ligase [Armatimonadetes bacterium]|nr:alanine--tRNA ligase [Armatimonadota bacterium]